MGITSHLNGGDIFIAVLSLLLVFGVGFWSSWTQRNREVARTNQRSTNDTVVGPGSSSASIPGGPEETATEDQEFFLAGRSAPWYLVAASLWASNLGTEHFVGQAGTAAAVGISAGNFEWTAAYFILALGWAFAPLYLKTRLATIPQYLELRFSRHCRAIMVGITLLSYIMAKISSSLYAGAVLLELVMGVGTWVSVPIIIVLTGLYTATGGLHAVLWTDAAQMMIFLLGGLVGMGVALGKVGGQPGMFKTLRDTGHPWMTHMIRAPNDRATPTPGIWMGQLVSATWYWCLDQEMSQRVLAAKGLVEAQKGTAAAAFLKVLPVFMIIFPGMAARTLYESCKASAGLKHPKWCETNLDQDSAANKAYPYLVILEFPSGIKGLMMASFLAAMMSSLSSLFNSASTLFTYDVYQCYLHKGKELAPERAVKVGRLATAAVVGCAMLWLPLMQAQNSQLYLISMSTLQHITPAVVAVFLLGALTRTASTRGALAGLAYGSTMGLIRLAVNMGSAKYCNKFGYLDPKWGKLIHITGANWFQCLHFSYFSFALFFSTGCVVVAVSLYYGPPDPATVAGLTMWDAWREVKGVKAAEKAARLKEKEAEEEKTRLERRERWSDTEPVLFPHKGGAGVGHVEMTAVAVGHVSTKSDAVPAVIVEDDLEAPRAAVVVDQLAPGAPMGHSGDYEDSETVAHHRRHPMGASGGSGSSVHSGASREEPPEAPDARLLVASQHASDQGDGWAAGGRDTDRIASRSASASVLRRPNASIGGTDPAAVPDASFPEAADSLAPGTRPIRKGAPLEAMRARASRVRARVASHPAVRNAKTAWNVVSASAPYVFMIAMVERVGIENLMAMYAVKIVTMLQFAYR